MDILLGQEKFSQSWPYEQIFALTMAQWATR